MSHTSTIFMLFPFLVGVMLFGIWSNIHVYAQQSSSSSPTLSPPTGNSVSKPISSELKTKMCDPSNPDLKVVNTTEARICGIPKTVKPSLPSTPPTSAVSSSPPSTQQQTITTKPAVAAPKQQQIKAVNNTHANATSRPADASGPGITITPVIHHATNASSSPSGIAPQIKAVNLQLQKQPPIKGINGTTGINSTVAAPINSIGPLSPIIPTSSATSVNSTAGQNYTFAATSLPAASDQFLYLGYHGPTKSNHGNSGSNHDDGNDDDSKPDNRRTTKSVSDGSSEDKEAKQFTPPRMKNTATNDDSTAKKRFSSSTKLDGTDGVRNDNSHSGDKIKSDSKPPYIKIIPPDSESKTTTKTPATSKEGKEDVSSPTNDNNNPKDKSSPDTASSDSDNHSILKKTRTKSDTKDSTSDDVNAKDDDPSTKSFVHRASSGTVTSGNDFNEQKKSQATNDGSNSKKGKSSHTDDGSKLFSASSSDSASSIKNKVDSSMRNSPGGIGHNLFGFSDDDGF
jgi:hypothetical protein